MRTNLIDPEDAWHNGRRVSDILEEDDQPNFSNGDLSHVDLSGYGFYDDGEGPRLADVSFWDCDLTGASLAFSDAQDANFWQATLDGADLTGTFLWGSDMRHATFEDAKTEHAAFFTADLRHTEFEDDS